MNPETLELAQPDRSVLQVTMNRPQRANALNSKMAEELFGVFERPSEFAPDARCLVLTGSGDRAFCAGADLKERLGMTDEAWHAQHRLFERAFAAVRDCPLPVIAAVNGAAYAGGLEIALGADFIYAAPEARFALTEVSLGIIPGGGGTQTLARAVGERRAKEIILAARPFTAEEARQWGLVNAVFKAREVLHWSVEAAKRIATMAPLSIAAARRAIHHGLSLDLERGLAYEIEEYDKLVGTADRREGIAAFNEKRSPRWQGK